MEVKICGWTIVVNLDPIPRFEPAILSAILDHAVEGKDCDIGTLFKKAGN